jgi:hypothetical protein
VQFVAATTLVAKFRPGLCLRQPREAACPKLLIGDEFGNLPVEPNAALFFNSSVVATKKAQSSHQQLQRWRMGPRVFGDDGASRDPRSLLHHSHLIATCGDSYRLKKSTSGLLQKVEARSEKNSVSAAQATASRPLVSAPCRARSPAACFSIGKHQGVSSSSHGGSIPDVAYTRCR